MTLLTEQDKNAALLASLSLKLSLMEERCEVQEELIAVLREALHVLAGEKHEG